MLVHQRVSTKPIQTTHWPAQRRIQGTVWENWSHWSPLDAEVLAGYTCWVMSQKGGGGWSLSRWGHAGNASVTTYLPGELHILLPRAFHSNPQSENSKWRILEVPTMQMPFIRALKLKKTESINLTAANNIWDPIEGRQGGHCTICT